MSLYDDMDTVKQKAEQVVGWSSGIKLLQSQLQLKKAVQTLPKKEAQRRAAVTLAPVIDLKSKKEEDENNSANNYLNFLPPKDSRAVAPPPVQNVQKDPDWIVEGEYDPMFPNDYEKVVKDLRDIRDREKEKEDEERRRRNREEREKRNRERYESSGQNLSGMGSNMEERGNERDRSERLERNDRDRDRDRSERRRSGFGTVRNEEDEEEEKQFSSTPRGGGAAIAPPPSLQESMNNDLPLLSKSAAANIAFGGSGGSVAAKIMAKYGFKEGQGLGKQEQGIANALQVEKTSKRGGRIINSEKDIMLPPMSMDSPTQPSKPEPSITEMMKSPSKVVLLRNMVGPGEVDEELEPEVKDECNTKYGDVIKVLIFEQPNVTPEEAVRIFVEFKRIESAIKAVVDLNGRFFGGRQVKAGFYSWERLNALQLLD